MSFLVHEDTEESIKLEHSWKEQLFCSCLVDEGTVPLIKNEPMLIRCMCSHCTYVCLGCVCVCVGGWVGGWEGVYLRLSSPLICKSHEL